MDQGSIQLCGPGPVQPQLQAEFTFILDGFSKQSKNKICLESRPIPFKGRNTLHIELVW